MQKELSPQQLYEVVVGKRMVNKYYRRQGVLGLIQSRACPCSGGLNAVPMTNKERADCKKILSPQQLYQVVVGKEMLYDQYKASELVTGSLLSHWNSMQFFATGSLSDMNSMQEVRFATLYRQSSNTSGIL